MEQKNLTKEIELVVTNLESFVGRIEDNLDTLNWQGKRGMIRYAVKRIEMGHDEINIVYKVNKLSENNNHNSVQHRCNRFFRLNECNRIERE